MTRIHTAAWAIACAVIGAMAITIAALVAGAVEAGPLDPPPPAAGPTGTQKTQNEIEPRTPISQPGSFPIVISAPGSYYLTENISGTASSDGITIGASDVSLDLNGFKLDGGGSTGMGIFVAAVNHVVIRNGTITNWNRGVDGFNGSDMRVEDLVVANSAGYGVEAGPNSVVDRVVADTNGNTGIKLNGGIVQESTVLNSPYGIYAVSARAMHNVVKNSTVAGFLAIDSTIEGNTVIGSTTGYYAGAASNSLIIHNASRGNTTPYDIAAGNTAGPIVTSANIGTDSNPHANYEY